MNFSFVKKLSKLNLFEVAISRCVMGHMGVVYIKMDNYPQQRRQLHLEGRGKEELKGTQNCKLKKTHKTKWTKLKN